jgi:uncharacterized protein YndB with AHSA1/START domain
MTDTATLDAYGILTEPATLTLRRLLPGPIERCWAYLTESDLRRQWLAAGAMELRLGAEFELVWRNGELNDPPTERPEGFSAEHRMQGRITELDPPHKLGISWGTTGGVTFDLLPHGSEVLLTVTHHRITERATLLNISAGWHAHLDVLVARATGRVPAPFWQTWQRLKSEYEVRLAE